MPFSCWVSLIFGEYSWRGVFGKGAGLTNTQPGPGRSPPPSATSASAPCSPTSCCAGSSSRSAASSDPPPQHRGRMPLLPVDCPPGAAALAPMSPSTESSKRRIHLYGVGRIPQKKVPLSQTPPKVFLWAVLGDSVVVGAVRKLTPPQPLSSWWMRVSSHHPFLFFRVNTVNRS